MFNSQNYPIGQTLHSTSFANRQRVTVIRSIDKSHVLVVVDGKPAIVKKSSLVK